MALATATILAGWFFGLPHAELWSIFASVLGYFAPNAWLAHRVRVRHLQLGRSLPDALDLLTTCVEAGLGLEAAFIRVTDEIEAAAPVLAHELRQATREVQAGMSRADAFRRLAERTGLDELRSLAAMLVQTELFGTSIAHSLRIHASGMRQRRAHLAEARAATVGVKLLLPLILCILPSLMSVILGPAIARILNILLPRLAGAQ